MREGRGEDNCKFRGSGKIFASDIARLRTRKKWICTVTPYYLNSIVCDYCPFSGRKLTYREISSETGTTASLDRIDPSLGYIEGNVRWIHKDVNRMKWKMVDDGFLRWISIIAINCKDKNVRDFQFNEQDKGSQPICVPRKKGRYIGYGRITGTYISSVRYWARDRNIFHPLLDGAMSNFQYLDSIVPALCPISGEKLTFPTHSMERFTTASLDRIDHAKGYEIGNVRWVHRIVNFMRVDMTDEEFISIVRDIAKTCFVMDDMIISL